MPYIKLQAGCLVIVLYIIFNYYKGCREIEDKHKPNLFDGVLWVGVASLIFDGVTAHTVNYLEVVPDSLNRILHMLFLMNVTAFVHLIYVYTLRRCEKYPKNKVIGVLLHAPCLICMLVTAFYIDELEFVQGKHTNYSMGVSVYSCFVSVAMCFVFTWITFFRGWKNIERHKRSSISIYLLTQVVLSLHQLFEPEALTSSLGVAIIIIGIYLNQENPTIKELSDYHQEMVMGLATLVEKRDGDTGGHIRRTSEYVELLAKELKERGYYKDTLTIDYIKNLKMAAPMHDIGKVSVPDAILNKPGKLTEDEFEIMKLHAQNGGKIINETFERIKDDEYREMAFQMAAYHHEKWNGEGYIYGMKEEEIPLCARIMAIADVFDAVSEDRCYREALPLEECFNIIKEGSGRDFDPLLVEIFLGMKDEVIKVHERIR